jgi:hypothetical protein
MKRFTLATVALISSLAFAQQTDESKPQAIETRIGTLEFTHQPTEAYFERSWSLPDFEQI